MPSAAAPEAGSTVAAAAAGTAAAGTAAAADTAAAAVASTDPACSKALVTEDARPGGRSRVGRPAQGTAAVESLGAGSSG